MTIRSHLHSMSRTAMRGANSTARPAGSRTDDATCAQVKSGLWKLLVAAAVLLVLMLGAMEFFHGEAAREFTRLAPPDHPQQSLQR